LNAVGIQGTKVLENREITRSMASVREGAPAGKILVEIIKYDGDQKEPAWMDTETSTTREKKIILLCLQSKRQI
jgi:hypothetical protein